MEQSSWSFVMKIDDEFKKVFWKLLEKDQKSRPKKIFLEKDIQNLREGKLKEIYVNV